MIHLHRQLKLYLDGSEIFIQSSLLIYHWLEAHDWLVNMLYIIDQKQLKQEEQFQYSTWFCVLSSPQKSSY